MIDGGHERAIESTMFGHVSGSSLDPKCLQNTCLSGKEAGTLYLDAKGR